MLRLDQVVVQTCVLDESRADTLGDALSALLTGLWSAGLLYFLVGFVFLRRSGLDGLTRTVVAAGVSYPLTTLVAEGLGALGILNRWSLLAAVTLLVAGAWRWPLPTHAISESREAGLAMPAAVGIAFGALALIQAFRPSVIRVWDGVAFWAPLASDVSGSGNLTPEWVPTLLEGFPPSVGLIAGSISLLSGGFAETHAFIVHPLYASLFLAAVVLLGGWLGGKNAAWIALATVLATPLLVRGVFFHDDLVVGFMATTAVLVGLRARGWHGWLVAGLLAGGAVAIKHIGVVAVLLLVALLAARRATAHSWVAAASGTLIGLPWYLGNVVRYGNPVFPLLPELFGESPEVIRVVTDQATNLDAAARGSLLRLGALTLAALGVGLVAALWRASSESDRETSRSVVLLVSATLIYLLVWATSGYATRHVLIVLPVLAAIAGWGLIDPRVTRRLGSGAVNIVAIVLFVLLITTSVWNVWSDFTGDEPPVAVQTGLFTVARGKYNDIRNTFDPPEDRMRVFGSIRHAWAYLSRADPGAAVLAFDQRRFYVPQTILGGNDVRALPIYDADDSEARHRALLAAGVGFVLDTGSGGMRHPLYALPPWTEMASRPDLYEVVAEGNRFTLYSVRGAHG